MTTSTAQPAPTETRRPNLELRRARQVMRLSQAEFAKAIRAAGEALGTPNQCTKRLVQKWESGEHAGCRPEYLVILQTLTGLGVRDLGFGAQDLDTDTEPASSGTESPSVAVEKSIERLRYAVDHPSEVGVTTAQLADAATARLYDLEHHCPARLLTATVHRHLSTVTALLEIARASGLRRRLTTVSVESMLLAGWLAFDQGDTTEANRFWDEVISAAQSTGDCPLLIVALTQQSYAAARRDDFASAWQLAYTAYTTGAPDEPRTRAWILSRIALYTAQLGDYDEAGTALCLAIETGATLTNPRPGDDSRPFSRTFGPAVLRATAAHAAALLGDTLTAIYHAAAAVKALGPSRDKTRALVLAELALTAAIIRDYDACAEHGIEAVSLTRSLETSLAADLLHHTAALLLPDPPTRPLRDLVAQIAQLPRTVDLEGVAERKGAITPAPTDHTPQDPDGQ